MRVTTALLADFALAHEDGKLYITGGGLHQLKFGRLPATYPRVSLAVELQIDPSERANPHAVVLEGVDPRGQPFIKPAPLSVSLPLPTIEVTSNHVQLVYNMVNLTFQLEGEYLFSVNIEGQAQATLPLQVLVVPGTADEVSALQLRLNEGFRAFTNADFDGAERHFRAVIEAMPTLGVAHNNLGFVLLAKGQTEQALATFKKAAETGFDRVELLDANLGCCYYRLGNPEASLAMFENCLTARSFTGAALLFGLNREGVFLAPLPSAGSYTRLMALNAAWSALRAGRPESAAKYLSMARGLMGLPADQYFVSAMDELIASLGE